MSVVAQRMEGEKLYLPAETAGISDAHLAKRCELTLTELLRRDGVDLPDELLIGKLADQLPAYGMRAFSDVMNKRQQVAVLSFAHFTRRCMHELLAEGYSQDHAGATNTYLALAVDKLALRLNTECTWATTSAGGRLTQAFGRQALEMVWDYAEANPFSDASGSWLLAVRDTAIHASYLAELADRATVFRGNASKLPFEEGFFDAIITDPPYYDNIQYSDLSDFFFVWLKRTVGSLFPEHFSGTHAPKKTEAVASPLRAGSKQDAYKFYEAAMSAAFVEAHRVLKKGCPLIVVYAHKTTAGWASLVESIRHAGFVVTEAWPLDTELTGHLKAQIAALASSIFLIARKREVMPIGQYEMEVVPQLEEIVRERVSTLWKMGITGADLVIASIGAGLRAFTRFEHVEYANGEEVPAERFLAEVEGVVLETMLEKIFGMSRSGVAAVDGPSRFYVLWRYTYKGAELDAGEAIVFTYGQPVELDGQKGLSSGSRALVEKKKSKYRLYDFTERGDNEKLGLPNEDGEAAPLIDALHRILWLMENKPRSLARFLDEARPDRERLRLVAQVLAGPALKGPSDSDPKTLPATTTGEQAAIGKLLANWRSLIDSRLEEFRLR